MESNFIKLSGFIDKAKSVDKETYNRIRLPFPKLNEAIKGINKGDLILLESRPSMGTTTFCVNLAVQLAMKKYKIAYLSLDNAQIELAEKFEKCISNYRTPTSKKTSKKNNQLAGLEIYFNKIFNCYEVDILDAINEMKREHNIDLFILDYLQLLSPIGDNLINQNQDNRDFIQSFKHAIRRYNTSMIVVSKLKNDAESNEYVPPGNVDCNIDWATDTVIILDNLSKYGCKHDYDGNNAENKFYLMIDKNKYVKNIDTLDRIDFSVDYEKQIVKEF